MIITFFIIIQANMSEQKKRNDKESMISLTPNVSWSTVYIEQRQIFYRNRIF